MIIGFCNEKGGVGKTTLAVHTATWLARQGYRAALVDLDTQGGVSHFLGVEPADDVAELLRSVLFFRPDRRAPIASYLFPCPAYSNLGLIRGYNETGAVEADLRQPGRPCPGAVLAEVAIYAIGLPWLAVVTGLGAEKTVAYGLTPFILGDLVKLVVAVVVVLGGRRVLGRWRSLPL